MTARVVPAYIAFLLLSAAAAAQMDEFQRQFMAASRRYLSETPIGITQRYLFSFDSAGSVPFDSGYCSIEKTGLTWRYRFGGVESFNDGTYLLRISNPGKYMIVSPSRRADSSAPGLLFSAGFSAFKHVKKIHFAEGLTRWKLSGGTSGVPMLEITFDTGQARIRTLIAELSPKHPFLEQLNAGIQGNPRTVFVRIDYAYTTELSKDGPKRSDYILVEGEAVTPADRYRDYQIKFVK